MMKTGWATVLCDMTRTQETMEKVTLQPHQVWRGGSKDLETVFRCEARAILKALQETTMGGVAHIHTDSLGVILELKALVGTDHINGREHCKIKG